MQVTIGLCIFLLSLYQTSTSNQVENGRVVRNPPPVPPPFTASQRSLSAIKVDPSGKVYTTQILKQQLANELGLPLRDLRIVDPSYPSQIQASFISRKKCILFCIENIKVVVQHHEALVFGPFQPEVFELLLLFLQKAIHFVWIAGMIFDEIIIYWLFLLLLHMMFPIRFKSLYLLFNCKLPR